MAALALVAGLACSTARVAPPGEAGAGDAARFAAVEGRAGRIRLAVTARRWSTPPQQVLVQHTALWVELENVSDTPLRFRPEDFRLRLGDEAVAAEEPLRLVHRGVTGSADEARVLRTLALRAATLAPGETDRGFLFFRRKFSLREPSPGLRLHATLHDAEHRRVLDEAEVPLELVR